MILRLNLFLKEGILFIVTIVLGMAVAYRELLLRPITSVLQVPQFSLTDLVFLACVIAFFLVATKLPRIGRFVLAIFFVLVIWSGIEIVFDTFAVAPWNFVFTLGILGLYFLWRNVLTHDGIIVLALAGIGATIGINITPMFAMVLLIALSFYDIVAVYVTRHMIQMAETMVKTGIIFGFIIPTQAKSFFMSRSVAKTKIGSQFTILGSGDVALPLVFISSLIRFSLPQAIIVALFSVAGVFLTHLLFVNQSERRPMAALPPIATMSLVGYFIALLML